MVEAAPSPTVARLAGALYLGTIVFGLFAEVGSRGSLIVGSDATVDFALRCVRARGTVSVIGVQQSRRFAFPLERAFAGGLTFRVGTCSVPEELPALFPLVQSGRLKPERYISHHLPLSKGAEAYDMFDRREAGALKMVLVP